jgi:predicted nucleic acid-binding protein
VLSEYYVNVTRKLDPGLSANEAWDDVQALLAWDPQPIDGALLQRGQSVSSRYGLSWWDSLVVAAAQAQGCSLLLTEGLQDRAVPTCCARKP